MMRLLKKELTLAMHPTAPMFLALSAMLLIPNYPYYVVFFYTGLAVFFTCLSGRENQDILYSLLLPVAKRDIVRARFAFVILLEMAQMLCAVPFAILRQAMPVPRNQVGMGANLSLFGLSLMLLGLFNLIFFRIYYRDVSHVGKAFGWSSVGMGGFIAAAETCDHVVPFVHDRLDTPDPQNLTAKLILLAVGGLLFALCTAAAYRRSVRNFEALDL